MFPSERRNREKSLRALHVCALSRVPFIVYFRLNFSRWVLLAAGWCWCSGLTLHSSSIELCCLQLQRLQMTDSALCPTVQVLIIININLSFRPLLTCRCEESARCWRSDYRQNMALPCIILGEELGEERSSSYAHLYSYGHGSWPGGLLANCFN